MEVDAYPYLFISLGMAFLMGLTALGSAEAITAAGSSSILYCQKRSIVTNAYVAIIMTSTIFMYGFIIGVTLLFKIDEITKNTDNLFSEAIKITQTCFFFGIVAYFSGRAMSETCKHGFPAINKSPNFFINFICMMSGIEVVLIMALIFSIVMISSSK